MAIIPPTPPAGPEGMPPEPSMDAPEQAGYDICIRVAGDGQLSVGVEKPGMPEGPSWQPAESIKTALTMALEMYRSNGDMAGMEGADAQFEAGFSGEARA